MNAFGHQMHNLAEVKTRWFDVRWGTNAELATNKDSALATSGAL